MTMKMNVNMAGGEFMLKENSTLPQNSLIFGVLRFRDSMDVILSEYVFLESRAGCYQFDHFQRTWRVREGFCVDSLI
jgi:hypothetical protein